MIFTPLIIHPMHPILINGSFRASSATTLFTAFNPTTRTAIDGAYPVSSWSDIDAALDAATSAFEAMLKLPRAVFAAFLENYAAKIESNLESLAKIAHEETGLPFLPRLRDVEGPRTVNQLRLAAAAARSVAVGAALALKQSRACLLVCLPCSAMGGTCREGSQEQNGR